MRRIMLEAISSECAEKWIAYFSQRWDNINIVLTIPPLVKAQSLIDSYIQQQQQKRWYIIAIINLNVGRSINFITCMMWIMDPILSWAGNFPKNDAWLHICTYFSSKKCPRVRIWGELKEQQWLLHFCVWNSHISAWVAKANHPPW